MLFRSRIVVDGRDAGTVIFPSALFKFYLDAEPDVRSQRRYKELIEKKQNVTYSIIHKELVKRDQDDSSRALSPLKPAADAIIINTSSMTVEEVVRKMQDCIDARTLQCHK